MKNYIEALESEIAHPEPAAVLDELLRLSVIIGLAPKQAQLGLLAEFLSRELCAKHLKETFVNVLRQHDYKVMPLPAAFIQEDAKLKMGVSAQLNEARFFQARMPEDRPEPSKAERLGMASRLRRISHALQHGHADGTPYGVNAAQDRAWAYEGTQAT